MKKLTKAVMGLGGFVPAVAAALNGYPLIVYTICALVILIYILKCWNERRLQKIKLEHDKTITKMDHEHKERMQRSKQEHEYRKELLKQAKVKKKKRKKKKR